MKYDPELTLSYGDSTAGTDTAYQMVISVCTEHKKLREESALPVITEPDTLDRTSGELSILRTMLIDIDSGKYG